MRPLKKGLLTLSLRERQFVQAMSVRLRSLAGEDNLGLEEFMLYLGDNVCRWAEHRFIDNGEGHPKQNKCVLPSLVRSRSDDTCNTVTPLR